MMEEGAFVFERVKVLLREFDHLAEGVRGRFVLLHGGGGREEALASLIRKELGGRRNKGRDEEAEIEDEFEGGIAENDFPCSTDSEDDDIDNETNRTNCSAQGERKGGYDCTECDEKFGRLYLLKKHKMEKHEDKVWEDSDFISIDNVRSMVNEWNVREDKEDKKKGERTRETREEESDYRYGPRTATCPQCGKKLASQVLVDAHIKRIHQGEKNPYECKECGQKFPRPSRLKWHLREKHGIMEGNLEELVPKVDDNNVEEESEASPTSCPPRPSSSSQVIKTEIEEMDFDEFATNVELGDDEEEDVMSPEWIPPQNLDLSDKDEDYQEEENVSDKEDDESRDKDYEPTLKGSKVSKKAKKFKSGKKWKKQYFKYDLTCTECKQSFKQQYELDAHILRKHFGEEKPYPCDLCDKKFRYISRLLGHKGKCHPESGPQLTSAQETENDKSEGKKGGAAKDYVTIEGEMPIFSTPKFHQSKLNVEIREALKEVKGSWPCEFCKKKYPSKVRLTGHVNEIHKGIKERPHICFVCGKGFQRCFTLIEHCHRHLIRRNEFNCEEEGCLKWFDTEMERDIHVRRVHQGLEKPCKCPKCPKTFKFSESMYCHIKLKHNISKTKVVNSAMEKRGPKPPLVFKCTKCQLRFPSKLSVEAHLRKTHYTQSIPCTIPTCTQKFYKEAHLWKHISLVHPETPDPNVTFPCPTCSRKFKSEPALDFHIRFKHNKEKLFMCEFCSQSFSQPRYLEYHQQSMHHKELGVVPLECSYCKLIYNNERSLDRHVKQCHTKEFDYKCAFCSQGFMFRTLYEAHLRVHTGEKPYKCRFCEKAFPKKTYCKNHERIHTGEMPWKCTFCSKGFSDKSTYNRHVESHGDQVYKCEDCGKEFKIWHSYRLHLKSHGRNVERKFKGALARWGLGERANEVVESGRSEDRQGGAVQEDDDDEGVEMPDLTKEIVEKVELDEQEEKVNLAENTFPILVSNSVLI